MNDKEDRLFDEKLRKAFADYEEAVPEELWSGIASGLDRMERKKKLTGMFWKVAGAAATVAAAAVAIFVVIRSENPGNSQEDAGNDASSYIARNESLTSADEQRSSVHADAISVLENSTSASDYVDSQTAGVTSSTNIENHQTCLGYDDAGNQDYITDNKADSNASDTAVGILANDHADDNDTAVGILANDHADDAYAAIDSCPALLDESDFEDIDDKPVKKVRAALAMAGNTSVNIDRSVQSVRRYAPPASITPTETVLSERTDNTNYSLPVTVGVGVKIFFAKRWAIGTGVNYTLLSKKVKVDYTEVDEESGVVTKNITTTMKNDQHYIGVPINVYFSIISNKNWDFYTYVGGAVDKCVANRYRSISGSEPFSYTRKTSGVQPSINLGLGVEFCPVKNIGIFIDPNLSYFFDCKQPRSIRTIQPLTFSASAGVRFRL